MSASEGPAGPPNDPWSGANPLDPAFRDDPHPALRRLRERDPVNQAPFGLWRLTRYRDVLRLLREANAGVRRSDGTLPPVPGPETPASALRGGFMLQQDPPAHTRLRRLVSKAFTPRAIEGLRPRIEQIVTECLDAAEKKDGMDVIADLALPVPSMVICEMLGVPLADRERFTLWTAEATHGLAAAIAPPDVLQRAASAALALSDYFRALIAERRKALTGDLLSAMIRAEEAGDRLSADELLSQAIGLLIAGFETTIGLIGNGVRALLQHPAELARLRARPELLPTAIEECLRFEGPILLTVRILHEDTEFGGRTIPKDATVMALLAAANRDPEVFPDPDRFDVGRTPNDHLAFGGGAHFCLGTHLARLEGGLAIGALVRRFPKLSLESERVEWGPSLFRVPGRLPIRFAPGL
jgi:cytochrome P450